jgi:hypothetical protein
MSSRVKVETARSPIPAAMAVAVVASLLALCATLLAPGSAEAQIRGNAQAEQSRAIGVRPSLNGLPPSGRYASESGETFVFDGSGSRPLFRFDRRTETWVLRATPAPRGDVIYRNDAGAQILRVTPGGGVTLYTTRAPNGSPASVVGAAAPLSLPQITPTQLITFSIQQSGRMSAALGHLVAVNIELDRPGLEPVVAETISVVTEAVLRMSRSATVRGQVAQVRRIQIEESTRAAVSFSEGTLTILIIGNQGLAGRPSSARIIRAVSGG